MCLRAVVSILAATYLVLSMHGTTTAHAQSPSGSAPGLERGTWRALMLTPGGEVGRAEFVVDHHGRDTWAYMKWYGGVVEISELSLVNDILSFTWEPSFYLTCRLQRAENHQYKGACLDSEKLVGPFVLSPPGRSIEPDDFDFDRAFSIWEIDREEYMRAHYSQPTSWADYEAPEPLPTKLVEIDGRRINVSAAGEGDVTVVFVSGIGDDHSVWHLAQLELSERVRTVSYDRPGLGRSDPRDGALTPQDMAAELRTLLAESGETAPFVLVGHGAAAFLVREFVANYSDDVAGVVFVDPAHEGEDDAWREIDADSWSEYVGKRKAFLSAVSPAAAREFDAYLEVLDTWDGRESSGSLGVPAVVLAGGRVAEDPDWVGVSAAGIQAREKLQKSMAEALGAELIRVPSGSYVHLEDTKPLLDAVQQVLDAHARHP